MLGMYELEGDDYLSLGHIYSNIYQINNAKKMYRKASRGRDSSVRRLAFINLGLLYLQEQKNNQAMWMYWKAAQSDPFAVNAWIGLSDLFHKKGNIEDAIETLKKGLRFQPSNISLLQCIRELYKINKNYWNYFKCSIFYHMFKNRKRNRIYKVLEQMK